MMPSPDITTRFIIRPEGHEYGGGMFVLTGTVQEAVHLTRRMINDGFTKTLIMDTRGNTYRLEDLKAAAALPPQTDDEGRSLVSD
jgi:hypothetical protein